MTPQIPHIPWYFTVNLLALPPLPEKESAHRCKGLIRFPSAQVFAAMPANSGTTGRVQGRKECYGNMLLTAGRVPCQTPMPTAAAVPVMITTRGVIGRVAATTAHWLAFPRI